jgi:hypothetical protein
MPTGQLNKKQEEMRICHLMVNNTARMHFGKVSNRVEMPTGQLNKKQEEMRRFLLGGSSSRWEMVAHNI